MLATLDALDANCSNTPNPEDHEDGVFTHDAPCLLSSTSEEAQEDGARTSKWLAPTACASHYGLFGDGRKTRAKWGASHYGLFGGGGKTRAKWGPSINVFE